METIINVVAAAGALGAVWFSEQPLTPTTRTGITRPSYLSAPGRMNVEDAHAICDRIERAMRDRVGAAVINIHVEPEYKAKHRGVPIVA